MAKTKEVSYYIGRKISDGDFGSYDIHVGEVAETEKGESFEEAYEEVKERVQSVFQEEVKAIRILKKKRMRRDS